MKTGIKYAAPWLALAAVGGAIALAPIASAEPTRSCRTALLPTLQHPWVP